MNKFWLITLYILISLIPTICFAGKFGVDGPEIFLDESSVSVSFLFEKWEIDEGITVPIKKYPNSSLYVGSDLDSDGAILRMTFEWADILKSGYESHPPTKLPGGRNIPGTIQGSLPMSAIKVEEWRDSIVYFGKDVVGFFIHMNLGNIPPITSKIKLKGEAVGNISFIPTDDSGENDGLLILLSIKQLRKLK